jgi:hypothetical protein
VRTLVQLANDEQEQFPIGAKIMKRDFYVDDLLSGCNNLATAKQAVTEIIELARKGKTDIRKWASNDTELLKIIPDELKISTLIEFSENEDETVKTLGIIWNPKTDQFSFKINTKKTKINKTNFNVHNSKIAIAGFTLKEPKIQLTTEREE